MCSTNEKGNVECQGHALHSDVNLAVTHLGTILKRKGTSTFGQ